jgi:hypothetical protein
MSIAPDDPRRCQAMVTDEEGNQRPCGNYSLVGTRFCEPHGGYRGLASVGPAHHNFIHGNNFKTKYRFPNLAQRFEEASKDPSLLDQREEIVIMGHLIQTALERLDSGDPGARWVQLQDTLKRFQRSRRAASVPGAPKIHAITAAEQLAQIENLIEAGAEQVVLRKEIRETIVDQEKIIRSERKRMQEMKQLIPVEDVLLMMQAVMHEINDCVHDSHDRMRLNNRLRGMVNGRI